MQIFRELAGYTFGKADIVRRAMAKKKASVMEAERGAFLAGCAKNGIPTEAAGKLFDDLSSFANYAFNKSHAAAYAVISYRTAYLKEHAPKAYFAALLTSELGNLPKIAAYIAEVNKRGVRVLPPDINESDVNFSVCGDHIRFGLLALKNVGKQFLEAVVREREQGGPYRSFEEFIERIAPYDLNKRQIESLIKAGAFDTLGVYRSRLMAVYEQLVDYQQGRNRVNLTGQLDMFAAIESTPTVNYPELPEYDLHTLLSQEKEASGMYFSGHVLDGFSKALSQTRIRLVENICQTDDTDAYLITENERVTVAGIVTAITVKPMKNGQKMAFFTLEDRTGEIECIIFSKLRERYLDILVNDNVLQVEGEISLREDEAPKILVSGLKQLLPNDKIDLTVTASSGAGAKSVASHLYLRVPSLSSPLYFEVRKYLLANTGDLALSFFDNEKRTYHKQIFGVKRDEAILARLREMLGAENVVPK